MRKKAIIGIIAVLSLAFGVITNAASNLETIQANLNHGIKFLLNGEEWIPQNANGEKITPISFNGTTYVPLRAVAEATGAEVSWDGQNQAISIKTRSQVKPDESGARQPFTSETVSHVQDPNNRHVNGITRNKNELKFGAKQYTTAFAVYDLNSNGGQVKFRVKEGTKRVGVLIGYRENENNHDTWATYSIVDENNTYVAGRIYDGEVQMNEFELPAGVTELTLKFEAQYNFESGDGYLIWDESWIE